MRLICPDIWVGNIRDYRKAKSLAILSACQTVHYERLGWNRRTVDKDSPHYIILERGNHLSLNWIDGPARYYESGGLSVFSLVLDFIQENTPILIHCDQGKSRSATLGLLYLAKRARSISNASFEAARDDFRIIYPDYQPAGIADYVADNWKKIL